MLKLWQVIRTSALSNWLRYVREELENQRLNRECIGQDRNGNSYYQYYSYYGLPTRREIRFKEPGDWQMRDLVYYRWLHKIEFDPPTENEKAQFYLEEQERLRKAAEWDRKEQLLMEQFRNQRQQLLLRNQALQELQEERAKGEELEIVSKRH